MLDVDQEKARKWLNITQQQYDIMKIVYKLENKGFEASPKNIQKEYKVEYGRYLVKPNIFKILNALLDRRVIAKVGKGRYCVDEIGIRKTLQEASKRLNSEIEEVENVKDEVEKFFRAVTYRREHPEIHYLEGGEFFNAMGESLEKAAVFNVVSNFPISAYTNEMVQVLKRERYSNALWKRCMKKKETQVNYLTDLDIDQLFNHAFRAYGDPRIAYMECLTVVDRLRTQVEIHKNLDVRHMEDPYGLDVAIAQVKEPYEFFIFTRDEHGDVQGGIKVKSRDTSANALKTFNRSFQYATELKNPQGRQILADTRKSIIIKYGILGE